MIRELIPVAPGVYVATSGLMHTTSTVLAESDQAFLIDPAWTPDELSGLAEWIDARGLRVIGGLATHAHHDHLLWHPRFGEAPRWASPGTVARATDERAELLRALGEDWPADLASVFGRVQEFSDRMPLPPGFEAELLVHDGHAPGHTALWLPRQRVLLAGDMLSDIELPLPFAPDDLPAYAAALELLAPYAAKATVVIPGHGTVGTDALARLDADRRYIDDMVRTGESADRRRANPGMAEVHVQMRRLVQQE